MASRRTGVGAGWRDAPAVQARRGPAHLTPAGVALALQRAAGNAAARQVLAREAATPEFNLMIVDNGSSGLDGATLKAARAEVEGELKRVTSASTVPAVKAGFSVQVVRSLEAGKPRDLGKRSFVVFLLAGKDANKAFDLAAEHIDLDHRRRKEIEAHMRRQIEAEGGVNEEWVPARAGRPSKSVAFVSTDRPVQMQADAKLGPTMAGQLLGDVILHELAHAAGHPDHDKQAGGIMAEARVIDSTGRYLADRFSKDSARLIRERLEWLAGR